MPEYKLSAHAMVMISGSSRGTQPKYYDQGWWYKADRKGYEGRAEYLVSLLESYSSISEYVPYETCMINGRRGCRSHSFLTGTETFLSFMRAHTMAYDRSLEDAIRGYEDIGDRIAYVMDFMMSYFGLDCSRYLSDILTLDMLTLNCDRHFNNLGFIYDTATGQCKNAPIFDNGDCLLSDLGIFYPGDDLETNIEKAIARPFSVNHYAQAKAAGISLSLDYEGLYAALEKEPEDRAREVLLYQLQRYRSVIPDMKAR